MNSPSQTTIQGRGRNRTSLRPQTGLLNGGRIHKLYSWLRSLASKTTPLGVVYPLALLRGFLRDLCTCFARMSKRCDVLPFGYSAKLGPVMERSAIGNLQPCIRTLACIEGIKRFEACHPEATEFDVEFFHLGWKMGAEWAGSNNSTKSLE